jgi:N-acetylmuramoyl-L-alanine amidase
MGGFYGGHAMGRFFISAGHGGYEDGLVDPGVVLEGTTEAEEMKLLRDMVVVELRSQGYDAQPVPDSLSARETLNWINARCHSTDVALEIHGGFFTDPSIRGSAVFYIAGNGTRQQQAEVVAIKYRSRVPELPSRGAKPDTEFSTGSAAFCRQIQCPSLLMEVAVLSNPEDLAILQNRRRDLAQGIASGMIAWNAMVDDSPPESEYPRINIDINGVRYGAPGIIINNNSFVPIDVADQLNADVSTDETVRKVRYADVVYIKAIDLRNYNVQIGWDGGTRTVLLTGEYALPFCPGAIDRIMGRGATSEAQLRDFMRSVNPEGANQFPELPQLYREEAELEGVNYDIAFGQMLTETNGLAFDPGSNAAQNNFGGLGAADGSAGGASFPDARTGVRAHIQHLKAYASTNPLYNRLVDPRFNYVKRGIAPLVEQLSGRWSADPQYGDKVMAYVRRLYDSITR